MGTHDFDVQTFLPYPDFAESARVLDRLRLGKQRAEAIQVLRAQFDPTYGWRNHPAVKMWQGHVDALVTYGLAVSHEWRNRGYVDTTHLEFESRATDGVVHTQEALGELGLLPPWLGDPVFHRAHQSSLVRKNPEWYRQFFPDVPDDLEYVWPVQEPPAPADQPRRARSGQARSTDSVSRSRRSPTSRSS